MTNLSKNQVSVNATEVRTTRDRKCIQEKEQENESKGGCFVEHGEISWHDDNIHTEWLGTPEIINNQYKYSLRYFNAFQITCKFKGNKPGNVNQYLNYLESRDMAK